MAATTTSTASTPPTPPTNLPVFARVTSASLLQRNASTSSSQSTTTSESTSSSLVAVPIRPPPLQTRTAATPEAQLPPPDYDTSQAAAYAAAYTSSSSLRGETGYDAVNGARGAQQHHLYQPHQQQQPQHRYGGRGFMHNGPRMDRPRMDRQHSFPLPPAIVTSPVDAPERSPSLPPNASISPTTPRASRLALPPLPPPPLPRTHVEAPFPLAPAAQLRSGVSMSPEDDMPPPPSYRGRAGPPTSSGPSTPTSYRGPQQRGAPRARSVDANPDRERRQSQASTQSNGSAASRRPSLRDYILGEELGRGSYSTVVRATLSPSSSTLSAQPRSTVNEFAIKIMNQAHLIQEKKAKYAHIERDALIRLAQPRAGGPARHRRGMSNSSSGGLGPGAPQSRKSTAGSSHLRHDSGGSSTLTAAMVTASPTHSPLVSATPLSPHPSQLRLSSDSQEVLDERPTAGAVRSRPPSPVKEEASEGLASAEASASEDVRVHVRREDPNDTLRMRTPRKRRQSLAPSERSSKSTSTSPVLTGHPGIIRLYCTFADKTSVYYVLELANHGELAAVIRKYGSLDMNSSRYYAAQLIDTIEFMHERGIIHRDLKPENILLDDDMRIKVTDFGSAKILGREDKEGSTTSKRSFVGSADYVSPEVLRSDPATTALDVWAFGVVLYDFITGKSPFRAATEFLTFQKVLKREIAYPEGFDPVAKDLIEWVLNLDPAKRPTPAEIKAHPFFAPIDWTTLWSIPAPKVKTGLTPPSKTLAQINLDSEVWSVFDEASDDGGHYSPGVAEAPAEASAYDPMPRYDRVAAADAVQSVDNPSQNTWPRRNGHGLNPPRRAWLEDEGSGSGSGDMQSKSRGWSTSSSSSGGRLSGLLETMGINPPFTQSSPAVTVGSRPASDRTDQQPSVQWSGSVKTRSRNRSPDVARSLGVAHVDNTRWTSLLLPNERVVLATPIVAKPASGPLPSFLSASKRRQLILTDLPRMLLVKDEPEPGDKPSDKPLVPKIKREFGFISHPAGVRVAKARSNGSNGTGKDKEKDKKSDDDQALSYILELHEKGGKMFSVQTATSAYTFIADTPDVKAAWMHTLRRVV